MKRALVLAGGGLKVAYQAGVLQVWLDEAQLEFDLADGASAGTFNLAMWAQGQSGREIADNWRLLSPWRYLWPTFARFRRNVYPDWGLNFAAIRRSERLATFNVFDFTGQQLLTKAPAELTEQWLDACVALPMWFPAVEIAGRTYVDAVFVTDANLEAAIAGGADELWLIWTVSREGRWRHGPISKYFQIVEESANGTLQRVLDRIDVSNAKGLAGEFGRPIAVKRLDGDVPVHYLLVFRRRALARAVELGVQEARAWCRVNRVPLKPPAGRPEPPLRFRFAEHMQGEIEGPGRQGRLDLALTARIAEVDVFVRDPVAQLLGTASCDELTGSLQIERGDLRMFVDDKLSYRLHVRDEAGHPLTILGEKRLGSGRGIRRAWRDTTTLYVRVLQGDVSPGQQDAAAVLAEGTLKLGFWAFLCELATFHGSLRARLRVSSFFAGELWRRYRWWR